MQCVPRYINLCRQVILLSKKRSWNQIKLQTHTSKRACRQNKTTHANKTRTHARNVYFILSHNTSRVESCLLVPCNLYFLVIHATTLNDYIFYLTSESTTKLDDSTHFGCIGQLSIFRFRGGAPKQLKP